MLLLLVVWKAVNIHKIKQEYTAYIAASWPNLWQHPLLHWKKKYCSHAYLLLMHGGWFYWENYAVIEPWWWVMGIRWQISRRTHICVMCVWERELHVTSWWHIQWKRFFWCFSNDGIEKLNVEEESFVYICSQFHNHLFSNLTHNAKAGMH